MTKLPTPVMRRPNIILKPSKYVVMFIPYEGIHSKLYTKVSPFAIWGIYVANIVNNVTGITRTIHPMWNNLRRLYTNGISIKEKNGSSIVSKIVTG